jgi:predicted SprT family Zn-dependent metalloprotease
MNAAEAVSIACQLLKEHGLASLGWRFRFDSAAARGGLCNHKRKMISVSWELTERNGMSFFMNTVLHEIAHALVGPGHHHDATWRKMALAIGATPERCHHAEPRWRFVGTCPRCFFQIGRMRKARGSCGRCSPGRYNPAVEFRWVTGPEFDSPKASVLATQLELDLG